ncbi:CRP-like cAMP-binding protein [Paraburkholderia silvatlantica]|uniref:CRP-like cAMP-binding protein n=2 Tax=Paraburkholderia silvatlantica TaxID=321895 RepID=A0ABR6FNC8_9BURK|nr:CRP-like cAMP-binding protein [Paraburkholderia silvatlantica]PVY35510.1 CRP-like cAMP-binding protein [Paraburkholderia silvatlantica]PXW41152.1 CRP-like cAMP-binding protein [Paraburkholderia silvatlantica]TDQ76234.1 CRP-like cAMP-binding protein [Paraburkholderia silvatlantica]
MSQSIMPPDGTPPARDSWREGERIDAASAARLAALFERCAWFRALAPEHREWVLASSHAQGYAAGAIVAAREAPSDWWLGVSSGLVKLAIFNASGRGCTFSGVPHGGWFGEGSVIKREPRKYDVIALQPSLVMAVATGTFHRLMDCSLPFNRFVIHQLNNRMGEFIALIQNSRLLGVDARVAQSLAQMFNPDLYPETGRALDISQEEIGMLAGASRQRINQALQTLESQGLVALSYNRVDVVDLDGLRAFGRDQI